MIQLRLSTSPFFTPNASGSNVNGCSSAERVRHALKVGPAGLNNAERLALLSDPVALARLHEQVWSEGHAEWLAAWRDSIKADPHAPLLPLQPLLSQAQPA